MFDRFGFGSARVRADEAGRPLVLATHPPGPGLAETLREALGPAIWRVGPDLPGSKGALARLLDRARPRQVIAVGALPWEDELARLIGDRLYWVNARTPSALQSPAVAVAVRDPDLTFHAPRAVVTGDPDLTLEGVPAVAGFCDRFQEMRDRHRWILYFAATVEPEETEAYRLFLQLSRRGVGLLALAPRDDARHEMVYRDAMRFHLMTNRHRRLITSLVPHKTRVYYIEEEAARRAMYTCADVTVLGGPLGGTPVAPDDADLAAALGSGGALVTGRLPDGSGSPLYQAAVADEVLKVAGDFAELERVLDVWLADPAQRAAQGARAARWWAAQHGARDRLLAFLRPPSAARSP